MKSKFFIIFSITLSVLVLLKFEVLATEPLVKYNLIYTTEPSGRRPLDPQTTDGFGGTKFRFGGPSLLSATQNPNSPRVGDVDDCYPDDPNNPEGNIVISGRIVSNFTNKPVNGAAVVVYMGAEHLENKGIAPGTFAFNEEFVVGGKDYKGRLTNYYYMDVSKDGYYKVYACNAYKKLSENRKREVEDLKRANNNQCPDGYVSTDGGRTCSIFDYVQAYPKFNLAVVCGMSQSSIDFTKPSPIIGEVFSIDNYNENYKTGNPPKFMQKGNFDIRVNCQDSIPPFPIPMYLEYASPNNVASCRMDDVSPNLKNYFNKVQSPLRNFNFDLQSKVIPGSVIPDENNLRECSNPDDIYCLKNFITKSFQKPTPGVNVFNYGAGTYLNPQNANPNTRNEILKYSTSYVDRTIDMSDAEGDRANFIADKVNSSYGQYDAKIDIKSYVDDVKFDLNNLRDLYACFTTFNAPANRSSAELDEKQYTEYLSDPNNKLYTPNIRIPSCKELYCGQEFVPNNEVCKVVKPQYDNQERFGNNYGVPDSEKYMQLNALTGYGPGITLNLESIEDISKKLMVLSKELISSDFNPKKDIPGVAYKPVSKVGDIVACLDDDGKPVFLNDGSNGKEGSITYKYNNSQINTFYSPVPFISFLSIPYNLEFFHSIVNDNYANRTGQTPNSLFPEQCDGDTTGQKFADCRSAVIPGGVYSVTALRLIAKICTDAVKLPTPDAGDFTRIMKLTGENKSSSRNNSDLKTGLDIDLSVTRIGTPLSLCLCKSGDYNCNYQTRLNNKNNPTDFAVASFVGAADQNKNNNFIGVKCDNKFTDSKNKTPAKECVAISEANSGANVPITDSNFLGAQNNLIVSWAYSMDQLRLGAGAGINHQFLNYSWQKGTNESPQTGTGDLFNLRGVFKVTDGNASFASVSDACTTAGVNSEGNIACLSHPRLTLALDPKQVSNQDLRGDEANGNLRNNPAAPSGVKDISYFQNEGGSPTVDHLKDSLVVKQFTLDGTVGTVRAAFEFANAKYDPIPDLLNDFRKFSIYGSVPGGEEYCRSPQVASVFDFKANEYEYGKRAEGDRAYDLVSSHTRGIHCNAQIPDEMERCNDPRNWIGSDMNSPEKCRISKCIAFCNQTNFARQVYFKYSDVDQGKYDYFCINNNPNVGVEMQMNTGDEGCVLDYVKRIKQVYAIPAKYDEEYTSVQNDPKYSKENYPVFNNNLCQNPSPDHPLDPSFAFDSSNCQLFVGDKLKEAQKIRNTRKSVDIRIN